MEHVSATVIDAINSRARGKYMDRLDARFCVETLGFTYPLTLYHKSWHASYWRVYKFQNANNGLPIWVVSVNLPRNWEHFDVPVEIVNEPQQQLDDRFIFALSQSPASDGNLCTHEIVEQFVDTIYRTMTVSHDNT
jgi:hypothetical protein